MMVGWPLGTGQAGGFSTLDWWRSSVKEINVFGLSLCPIKIPAE